MTTFEFLAGMGSLLAILLMYLLAVLAFA